MEEIIAVSIPIVGMALAFGIVYVNRSATNKEKMSMLEKGFTPQEIVEALNTKPKEGNTLSNGLLFAGVGIGLIAGYFLAANTDIKPLIAYFAGAFLFGGIGLIIANLLTKNKAQE